MAKARKIASPGRKRVNLPKAAVDAVFGAYPGQVRAKLLALRKLIFDTAKATSGVGALEETLKWGQPSYLTTESKSGSTIRIDQVKAEAGGYAVYFPELFPTRLRSTGSGMCFNGGRLLAAPVLFWIVPWLKGIPHLDLRVAVMLVSLFYLLGLGILYFLPETKGQALPED